MPDQDQTGSRPSETAAGDDARAHIGDLLSGAWKFTALHAFVDL